MQFHITKTNFYFRTIVWTQVVSFNKLAHIRNELSWEFNVGIITPLGTSLSNGFLPRIHFVSFLFNFSDVGTEPWLPGYYQYFFGVNVSCSRTQHGNHCEDRTPYPLLLLSQNAIFDVLLIFMTMRMR